MPEIRTKEMLSNEMHNSLNAVAGLATSIAQLRLMMQNELRKGGSLNIEQMGTIFGHCESPLEMVDIFEKASTWFTTITAILNVGYSGKEMTMSNVRNRILDFHQLVRNEKGEPVFGFKETGRLTEEAIKTFDEDVKSGIECINSLITA